ncbi:WD40-repeat-containing domain protein [Fimicolochytrium jonesii]|uniref:WD40-repeat-containing domain protein n=1 Tax=Fimicolochytrium jonesii TaxID=1396493 RepID=UPI0022FE8D19|nr:WD40-repeat-containing domain protein [Fimicolochytrium jonesii]KAI8818520.1 WD40-repeat-containing domain protein [Fimicolochytrium jonesii]
MAGPGMTTPQKPTTPGSTSSSSSGSAALQPLPTPTTATPRKRRWSETDGADEFASRGPFDRFVASGVSPLATPQLRHAFRHHGGTSPPQPPTPRTTPKSLYASSLGVDTNIDGRLLQHGVSPTTPTAPEQLTLDRLTATPTKHGERAFPLEDERALTKQRIIPRTPERVLDAPGMRNDYYIDVLDWSADNILAVGLGNKVYLWEEHTSAIHELWTVDEDDYIASCKFSPDGSRLAVGTNEGRCEIFTVPRLRFKEGRCLARIRHRDGLGALIWCKKDDNLYLTTGDKKGTIRVYNTTERRAGASAGQSLQQRTHCVLVREWEGTHTDRIVGLKWTKDARLLASGGNDNLVVIWQLERETPKHIIRDHMSAVRALDWCPWDEDLLATGGGLDDRKIRVYTSRGEKRLEIETGSQVCSLHWSPYAQNHHRELISTHHTLGDQLIIWHWPSMREVGRLPGHTQRPLFLAVSPGGEVVVTGSGDENLKFWKCWALSDVGPRSVGAGASAKVGAGGLSADLR